MVIEHVLSLPDDFASGSESPIANDLMEAAKKHEIESIEVWLESCAGMSSACRDAIRSALLFATAFSFYMNAAVFRQNITDEDIKFEGISPVSAKSKHALHFAFSVDQIKDSNPKFAEGTLMIAMLKSADDVLGALRQVAVSPDTVSGKAIQEACGATIEDLSPDACEQALDTLSFAIAKIRALRGTAENTDNLAQMLEKLSSLKAAFGKENGGLSDADFAAKNRLEAAMDDLRAAFPPLNDGQLKMATMQMLKDMVVPRKNLAELSQKFFQAQQNSDCDTSRFGKMLPTEIAQVSSQAKVLLAIQSAFSVLNARKDARTKAASFEKDKLSPKRMTLDDLPRCLVAELRALSRGNAADSSC